MQLKAGRLAFRVALIYIIVAGSWILFSDKLLAQFITNADKIIHLSIIKGLGFVLVTGGLLYRLLSLWLKRWEQEAEQRLAAVAELQRSERALKTISGCNQVLVRATTETGLLEEICRVIVAQGGYRLAWVGVAENDEKKSVRIAAHAGHNDGYLEQLQATWADTERGRSPTGTAIRTGQITVCPDCQTDPTVAPWRAAAAQRGYGSAIALPLRIADKAFGALTLYAAAANVFSPAEIELLTELADDLAYGLQALRTRAEQEQAEAGLRQSEWRFRSLIQDVLSVAVQGYGADGTVQYWNQASERLYGYSATETVGKNLLDLIIPQEMRAEVQAAIRQMARSGQPIPASELSLMRRDGSRVPVFSSHAVVQLPGREPELFCIDIDLTARKQEEAARQRSEQNYREIFNATNDAIFLHDAATGRILDVNEAMLRMYGYDSKTEILAGSMARLSADEPPYTWAEGQRFMGQAIQEGPQIFEWLARRQNGERFWVEVSLRSSQLDGQNRILAVVRDITARKQAEDQTRAFAQLSQRLSVSTDPLGAADAVADTALELLNWDACFLLLYDSASDRIRELINKDTINEQRVTVPVPMGLIHPTPMLRRVIEQGGQLVLRREATDDIGNTRRFGDLSRVSLSLLYVPLRHLGRVTGFLSVQSYRRNAYTPKDLATLQALADQCAGAIARIQAEAALRASENRLQFLLTASSAIIYSRHAAGDFATSFVSPNISEVLGYEPEAFTSRPEFWQAHVHPDDLRSGMADLASLAQADTLTREYRFRHANGSYRWIHDEIRVVRDVQKQPQELVGYWFDITARKQAEAEPKRSHDQYQRAIIAANAIPYQKDYAADVYVFMGEGIKDLTGYAPAELRSNVWKEIILETVFLGEAAGLTAAEAIRRILHGELKGWHTDHRIRARSGEIRWITDASIPLFDAGGNYTGSIGIIQDITERKQAEATLRLIRFSMEAASDALFWMTPDARIVDVNPAACRALGYTREELLQLRVEDVDVHYSAELWPQHFSELRQHGSLTFESVHRAKDGRLIPVEIAANHVAYGSEERNCAFVRDITARKQAEAAVRESEADLNRAQAVSHTGSWRSDMQRQAIHWSAETYRIFEIPLGTPVTPERFLACIHPEDRGLVDPTQLQATPGEFFEFRIVVGGRVKWVRERAELEFDPAGKLLSVFGTVQDITERKQAEAQMNLQSSVLTVAANAIAITDRQGRIEWVNPAFTRLTGYSADECLGRNPRMMKSGQQTTAFYAELWATILAGNVWHGELVNKRKDGRLYTEDMTITPVRDTDSQLRHFVAIKQDVTERRLLENQLRQAQKMEAIGTLAGGIAHDFNNILAAVFGYTYLLQAETEGNPSVQDSIEEILKAAHRAKDLVQQILTFSRQREHKREVIRLDTVVKEATKFLRASLPAEIKIEINLAAEAPAVLADSTQIYQVTMNLATNALHAMEGRPGRLAVNLEAFQPDAAMLSAHPALRPIPYARLTVADTGLGMDAKTLARIFEPFFTTKPVGKGTGLGLSVVHGIVQGHDGVITAESQPGQGTTFRVYFPAQTSVASLTASAVGQAATGHGQRILLVDDEPALTAIFQRLLERQNYHVTVSNRAPEALALFRKNPAAFDLIITDLTMPEMNGLEVARQIHTLRPELLVILASGYTPSLNEINLVDAGIFEVIEKPVSQIALADVVRRALAQA